MELNRKLGLAPLVAAGMMFASTAQAIPVLQVYIEGATAGDAAGDQDTWFGASNPFDLQLIGNLGTANSGTISITNGILVFTVPDKQALTIQLAICDGAGNCDAMASGTSSLQLYDDRTAFETYVGGLRTDDVLQTNNHNPYGLPANEVDLFAFSLDSWSESYGTFSRDITGLPDCNADVAGTTGCDTTSNTSQGEIKYLRIGIGGVDFAHMDLLALVHNANGRAWVWNENPGSHDSTCCTRVPEPTSLSLLGLGLLGFGLIRRRVGAG